MIYTYDQVHAIHFELTDRCNAACPMCPRYDQKTGDEAPWVERTQLRLYDIQGMLDPRFIRDQLQRVNFCGNYGDPIVAKDLFGIIDYFRRLNPTMRIEVNTNGSAHTEDWWRLLAGLIGGEEDLGGVWFGIDGLRDTNHLYRRNTNFDMIMRNAQAFIDVGGIAHWNFIAFKHNEHQIEEARALAKEMGFKHFNVKLTGRFKTDQTFPVVVKGQHLYDLEPAQAERHQRPVLLPGTVEPKSEAQSRMEWYKGYFQRKGYLDGRTQIPVETTPPVIECVAQEESCIYISARGLVYPCCWIGDAHNTDSQINFDPDSIDLRKKSLRDILHGPEFQSVQDSWATGSILKCVRFCGVNETEDKSKHGPDYVIHERADET